MQVTSATQTQYIPTTSKTNTEQEIHNPFKGQDYVLKTLDDEGNKLLNNALVGKTDEEKWMIKLGLDMELSTEIKDGTLSNKTTIDNSKENAMSMLDAFIQRRKELATPDMIGVGAIAEKLLEAYKASNSSFNIQNTEDSVVDSFLDDLYSSGSTATASAITKDTIKNKVNEYAQTLMETRDDTSESKLEVSKILNDYKKELLNEYKESLEGSKNGSMTLQQEAIIKVLLDENTKEASSLEKLLAQKIDTKDETTSTQSGANYYMQNLDRRGNEIVNNLISGKTDTEKFAIKSIMDRQLNFKNTEAYAMIVDVFNEHNNSDIQVSIQPDGFKNKETFLVNLNEFIERQSKGVDNLGILEVAKQLRTEYMKVNEEEL